MRAYERGADITMIGGLINGLGLSMIGAKIAQLVYLRTRTEPAA